MKIIHQNSHFVKWEGNSAKLASVVGRAETVGDTHPPRAATEAVTVSSDKVAESLAQAPAGSKKRQVLTVRYSGAKLLIVRTHATKLRV